MNYELIETPMGEQQIKRTNDDGSESWIPTDPANSDYAAYLEWVAEQTPKSKK